MWAQVPECYRHAPPRLQPGYFTKFAQDTLFYIFYSMPGDEAQLFAADELQHRGWAYHKEFKVFPVGLNSHSLDHTSLLLMSIVLALRFANLACFQHS